MPHDKHKKKNDDLENIIGMSNDESLRKKKSNNELDDYEDYSDDDEDNDSDDDRKKKKKKDKKYDETDNDSDDEDDETDDEFVAPKIKAKRAKPKRQTSFTNSAISETQRTKGVEALGQRLNDNSNLHQIKIAFPYGQDMYGAGGGYVEQFNEQPKTKTPFWKKRWFSLALKVVIFVCVFVCLGIFIYKYLKAMEALRKKTDIFADDDKSNGMSGGEIEQADVLTDREYNSLGKTCNTTIPTKARQPKRVGSLLRDSKGRFVKRK